MKKIILLGAMLLTMFAMLACTTNTELEDTSWRLYSIDDNLVDNGDITVEFNDLGDITGWTGCNAYAGRYSTSGDGSFVVKNLQKTEAGCPNIELFAQEVEYVYILVNATQYNVRLFRLTITGSDGRELDFLFKVWYNHCYSYY